MVKLFLARSLLSSLYLKGDVLMLVFGPVRSRRLGRSLGINNIPPKHCSYSCLYCQVGPTNATEAQPLAFYSPEAVFDAVEQHLEKLKGNYFYLRTDQTTVEQQS